MTLVGDEREEIVFGAWGRENTRLKYIKYDGSFCAFF